MSDNAILETALRELLAQVNRWDFYDNKINAAVAQAAAALERKQLALDEEVTDELLPCPFCGGEAECDRTTERFEYSTGGPNSVMEWGYYVYCTECGAGTAAINVPPPSPEEAAAEWNRRTTGAA